MLADLKQAKKLIGIKQTRKAIIENKAQKVYIAQDAEEKLTQPIEQLCIDNSINIEYIETMNDLGKACGIQVGASAVTIIK